MLTASRLFTTPPEPLPWPRIAAPLAAAEDALARLDERLAKSPIRDGWIARTHFADACSSLWLDGMLVMREDLVFHDAGMNLHAPAHELTQAHAVLRLRRRIAAAEPGWALSAQGLDTLRGRTAADQKERQGKSDQGKSDKDGQPPGLDMDKPDSENAGDARFRAAAEPEDTMLDAAFQALDAAIARTNLRLTGEARRPATFRDPLIHDPDWDEDARLREWRLTTEQTRTYPPVLAAALALLNWETIAPLQHKPWLGRLLAASHLRQRGKTRAHLACLNSGLRAVPRERRSNRDQTTRLIALIEALTASADAGLKDHDRWQGVRTQLMRKCEGRRSTSKLPALVDYMMACPIASAGMIADALHITPRAAQDLMVELGIRETTGRTRYRAWGIL